MEALLSDLERSGPEPASGGPLRAVVVLARDAAGLDAAPDDAIAQRRRRAAAARLARRSLSLACEVQGALGPRPEASLAWEWNVREVGRRLEEAPEQSWIRALGRVADLVLLLPDVPEEDDWQAGAIAFGDEGVLAELREALLDLAVAALRLA